MKIILKDMQPDDWILGVRAAKWMIGQFRKDAVLTYDRTPQPLDLYVKRNKASITVRPCNWSAPQKFKEHGERHDVVA